MGALPRKVARLLLLTLVLFSGGGFVTWYAQEKAAGVQEMMQDCLDGVVASLPTPTVMPPQPISTP